MRKRWFPVSHDINSDPEVWTMRKQIGEKSFSIWLEFLSIADRNEGEIPGDYDMLMRSIAGKCQATVRSVTLVYQFAISRLWLDSQPTLRTAKHWKYHRREERKPVPSDPIRTNPILTEPIKITLKRKTTYPENFELTDSLRSWCEAEGVSNPQSYVDAFRDHHIAKGTLFIDWVAAFRTWIRNAYRFDQPRRERHDKGINEPPGFAAIHQILRENQSK